MSTPTPSSPARHVVFGAGAVGLHLAEALVRRGVPASDVRLVNRSGTAAAPAGVQTVGGDVLGDPDFAVTAARGATVVYQVLNPAYHRWAEEFPVLQDRVLDAAARAGARLVTLENVYAYGRPAPGRTLTEDTPFDAHTRKGAVRARMHLDLVAAHDVGRVEVTVGRASDYYGPRAGIQSPLGTPVLKAARSNGKAQVVGDADQPHSYTYLPDIAEGLAVLGEHSDAVGRVWHLPNDPRTQTTRQMIDTLYRLAGHGRARLTRTPAWLLRGVGLFQPAAGEMVEMIYEFEEPFVVDSSRIAEKLGVAATPIDEALAATLRAFTRGT